jgi:hypothetical protein
LLLQSCRKKDTDEISTFLELLEKQQQEQSSFDACSGIEKYHGVGYTKQNAVVRPKEAIWFPLFMNSVFFAYLSGSSNLVTGHLEPCSS